MSIETADNLRIKLQESFNNLLKSIGRIQIGTPKQFPMGWRKAAKGRTVWRILEELVTQNLEAHADKYGIKAFKTSDSEVTVYDFSVYYEDIDECAYINVKSAVDGGPSRKDDISKFEKLNQFYESFQVRPHFFIATFFIKFHDDMTIEITGCSVFPIAWVLESDIGINTSNNGNIQLSKYKSLAVIEKRTNQEFLDVLRAKVDAALQRKVAKASAKKPPLDTLL